MARRMLALLELVRRRRTAGARLIQSTWRMFYHRARLVRATESIILCQNTVRRKLAFLELARRRRTAGAELIQSTWRMFYHRTRLVRKQHACRRIQASIRSWFSRGSYSTTRRSVCVIQSAWRRNMALKRFKQHVDRIIVLQKCVRRFSAHLQACQRREAVLIFQCALRCTIARRHSKSLRRQKCLNMESATTIQTAWRRFTAVMGFRAATSSIVAIQSAYRLWAARCISGRRLGAVLAIQSVMRKSLVRQAFNTVKQCSIKVQSFYRGYLVRRELSLMHTSATSIQSVFRGFSNWLSYELDKCDVITVQSVVRRWGAQRELQIRQWAVQTLQAVGRGFLARNFVSYLQADVREYQRLVSGAITVQRAFRGSQGRQLAWEHYAARSIQKTWRCYVNHVDFMISIFAATEVQALVRRFLSRANIRRRRMAVQVLHSFARTALSRLYLANLHRNAVLIQTTVRMLIGQTCFSTKKIAAIDIQRMGRGFLVRLEKKMQIAGACHIQRIWRGYDVYVDYVCLLIASIRIQVQWRAALARARVDLVRKTAIADHFCRIRSVSKIQRTFRRYADDKRMSCYARTIQAAFRLFLAKAAIFKFRRAVTRLQSHVRGVRVRKKSSKRLLSHLGRIHKANAEAAHKPKLRMGYRTIAALQILQRSKRLTEIMAAVCTLEAATRYSEVCCTSFVEAGAPAILFSLIRTCNRSLPHEKLLHYILRTLTNTAQYPMLVPSIGTVEGGDVFLDLVIMFRDKVAVFYLASMLLERVVHHSVEFRPICGSRENVKRLKGVNALCTRTLSVMGEKCSSIQPFQSICAYNTPTHLKHKGDDLRQGVRALRRVLSIVTVTK
jgi:abnormal spindle-like microcephaly-associated protein